MLVAGILAMDRVYTDDSIGGVGWRIELSRSELPRSESNGASHQVLEELRIAAVTASQTRSARAADLASCLLSHDRRGRKTLNTCTECIIANCIYCYKVDILLLDPLSFSSNPLFLLPSSLLSFHLLS